ncbi:hypothetical protein SAMN02745857_03221 [Andreprevotia lacus DSM 23236]|jgi:hypothetical protein|uniref:Integral membrane protein, YkoY family n=1 Tax=Andreprevotia lacus DSM 23236 TaxID=1121001 RepID=A0A1W1XWY5_9NEIS|nr:DUF475 domain-containing protein [Andreprevotia lacus]SMC28372.1 hypothetical protein SAMN02745857_03221 [Andreprevotia lacus DSM 23236]
MRHFRLSIFVAILCLGLAFFWGQKSAGGGVAAVTLALLLGIMEVSLSFDNAVVNAAILKEMDHRWRQIFLTVGILIAVFGMRLLFPIVVVAAATGEQLIAVAQLALNKPEEYARHLTDAHAGIASFGGMFLLLVFFSFLFDEGKELHWLGKVEEYLAKLGKLDSVRIICALGALLIAQAFLPIDATTRLAIVVAGMGGIFLYVVVDSVGSLFGDGEASDAAGKAAKRAGVMGFLYLEVLDASFSFDGVIGAFAVTRDVVIIMLGLAIGAMFVRSLTVYLVEKGTLDEYVFLEHGAHYAIGALAIIMFGSIVWHISEVVTGLIGVAFIAAALASSLIYKKNNPELAGETEAAR